MLDKEMGKIEVIIKKLEKLVCPLNGKNYDFTYFLQSENFFNDFALKLDSFEFEKNKQDSMKDVVKKAMDGKFKDYLLQMLAEGKYQGSFDELFESIIRIEAYENYYMLWLYGVPYMNVNFIFDKNGTLLFDNKMIYQLDNKNFVIIKYNLKEMRDKLYHYQLVGDKFELVKTLDNVLDIDYNDFFNDDLIVCSCGENKLLYNYKKKEIVVPCYSGVFSDLGMFNLENEKDYVRIVQNIFDIEDYRSVIVGRLEYLVDKNGILASDGVFDLKNNHCYSFDGVEGKQVDLLNSIYEEVKNNYRLDVNRRVKKR